ncbi:MAG: hypothetical protein GY904_08130, partial [Planctomycetaceae bacterium]|nr:hypothetical protein [Planctomycetaceae bacterium]
QILNLNSLAPDIQQTVIAMADHPTRSAPLKEADLRQYSHIHSWKKQRRLFQTLIGGKEKIGG